MPNFGVYDFNVIREHLEKLRKEEEANREKINNGVDISPSNNSGPQGHSSGYDSFCGYN